MGPTGQCLDEGVLNGLLRKIEVAELAGEDADQPRRLLAKGDLEVAGRWRGHCR